MLDESLVHYIMAKEFLNMFDESLLNFHKTKLALSRQ